MGAATLPTAADLGLIGVGGSEWPTNESEKPASAFLLPVRLPDPMNRPVESGSLLCTRCRRTIRFFKIELQCPLAAGWTKLAPILAGWGDIRPTIRLIERVQATIAIQTHHALL